jgi:hypothetical protein
MAIGKIQVLSVSIITGESKAFFFAHEQLTEAVLYIHVSA